MRSPEPYAQFWRCDLQTHSPLEPEFAPGIPIGDKAASSAAAERYVETAVERGLDAIAITDHNRVSFVEAFAKAAAGKLIVFPGVEVSASDGYHLLAIFEPGTAPARIQEFLAKVGIEKDKERTTQGEPVCAEEPWTWGKIVDLLYDRSDAIAIAPHVRGNKGILKSSIAGEVRARQWKNPHLYAVEDNKNVLGGESMTDKIMLNELDDYRRERLPARIWGSDCKSYEAIGSASTFIKMTEPNIEGLRQAFLDPGSRVRHPDDHAVAARDRFLSVGWEAGFLAGQRVVFSEQLSCLIGGKGTGKSTVIESIRFALEKGYEVPALAKQYGELCESALPPGTRVTLEMVRHDGIRYTVSRTEPYEAEVIDETGAVVEIPALDTVDPTILSQGEILAIARRPTSHLTLLDLFIEEDLADLHGAEEKIRRKLTKNRSQFVEASEEREALAEDRGEIVRLKEAKKAYDKSGVSARTEQRRALDREERLVGEAVAAAVKAESEAEELEDGEEDLPELLSDEKLPHHSLWKPLRTRWKKANKIIADLSAEGSGLFAALADDLREATSSNSVWAKSIARQREEVSAIYRELQEEYPDLDLAQFDKLDRALETLQSRVEDSLDVEGRIAGLESERKKLLKALRDNRREQFALRSRLAAKLNQALRGSVRIDVEFLGEREAALDALSELKTGVRRDALQRIAEHDDFTPERLGEALGAGSEETAALFGLTEGQASTLVNKTSLDARLALQELAIPDRVVINFNVSRRGEETRFRNLLQVSVGQKATCILLILLAQDGPPLIVDQPEDDLDNRFIYHDIVERLRDVKNSRQLILSTHNANIPVLGDAELIAVMDTEERGGAIGGTVADLGSIDSPAIRQAVTQILEGGRQAFRRRQEKYGTPGLDESDDD